MQIQKKRIAIIGAGIAGLTCGYELKKAGHEVTVFEKDTHVGGRMSSRLKDGFLFDLGADHLCNLYDEMKGYCKEFDIPWEKMRFSRYGISKDRAILPLDHAVGRWSQAKLALFYLTLAATGSFFNLSALTDHDEGNAYSYMHDRLGKDIADYLVDAFTTTYQFHRATEISKGALLGILSSIKRDGNGWDLHRTKGGMQALPNAFAHRLNVRTGCGASDVTAHKDTVMVTSGQTESFDAVVLACQAPNSLRLYTNPTDAQRSIVESARYAASISIAFRVPTARLKDYSVVWIPFVESQKLSGFVNESMKGDELIHDGQSLICTWMHEDVANSLMDASDEMIFDVAKKEFVRVCPWFTEPEQLVNHDLQRWPLAMPKFYPGYLKNVQTFLEDHQGEQNVFFCGDYLNAPWTEGALRNGQRVAKAVIAQLS